MTGSSPFVSLSVARLLARLLARHNASKRTGGRSQWQQQGTVLV
eukprot:COSAG01_NODE_18996_length_1038_cov_1.564430_3_plen_43_part_01